MGAAECSQYCEVGCSKAPGGAPPRALAAAPLEEGPGGQLSGLSYTPLPPPDSTDVLEGLLGTRLPQKPRSWATGAAQGVPLGMSTSSRTDGGPSCARPGEPVNKVYVQFSNDLEGFLPYMLVISEELGLEFCSLSLNPDFSLNPLNVMRLNKVSYEELMHDSFFASLSKSVLERPELWPGGAVVPMTAEQPQALPRMLEERVRPPYVALVQLSIRRPILEGGQVIVFIAVQSEGLATELIRSCDQLRRRRLVRHAVQVPTATAAADLAQEPGGRPGSPRSGVPSRGCPTPRTVVASRMQPVVACSQSAAAAEGGGPPVTKQRGVLNKPVN